MKILLINPPNYSISMLEEEIANIKSGKCDFTRSMDWRPSVPLGILFLAGELRKNGFDIQILDLHKAFYECREKGYFIENDLTIFFQDHFERILSANRFDVIGISCLFNVSSDTVANLGFICRKSSPHTKIVMGGHYPTNMYREILKAKVCDYVILGEAEEEFGWFLNHMSEPGIISNNSHIADLNCIDRFDKSPAIVKNLDSIAMPAWDLLPQAIEYIESSVHAKRVGIADDKKDVKSAPILTTRGCPMKCTFCAAHRVHGRTVRSHSIEYIMRHIDWLVDKYGINTLLIEDDMFNYSPRRAIEFCQSLFKKYNDRFNIEFPNGIAAWKLNEELIINLKRVGLKSITIAIESGSPYVQKFILKKNLNLDSVKEKIELLKKHEIGIRVFYIVGFVGETIEMMQETVQFALDVKTDWSEIKIFTPLVGSEMYDIAKKNGCLSNDMSEHVYNRSCVKTPDFSIEQVKDIQYNANIQINFLNNRFLKEKRYEEAEQVFRGLLRAFPNHLFAQWGLWQAIEGQGKNVIAQEALNRLIDLSRESEKNRFLLKKYRININLG